MLKYIYDATQISQAQSAFEERFRSGATIMTVNVGYPGGNRKAEVAWLPLVDIWAGSWKRDNRYVNVFGIGQPDTRKSNSISCEINFPLSGTNARIQGVLAKDDGGIIWVCHRGGIGGGKKGVGSSFFWDGFPGKWVSVSGDRVASIGAISMPDFPALVSTFAKFVQEIKPPNKVSRKHAASPPVL